MAVVRERAGHKLRRAARSTPPPGLWPRQVQSDERRLLVTHFPSTSSLGLGWPLVPDSMATS